MRSDDFVIGGGPAREDVQKIYDVCTIEPVEHRGIILDNNMMYTQGRKKSAGLKCEIDSHTREREKSARGLFDWSKVNTIVV